MPLLAVAAATVDEYFVIFHDKTLRHQVFQVPRTAGHLKHASAQPATEVVMMGLARQFITLGFPGDVNDHDRARFCQAFQCAIYGREAHIRYGRLGGLQQFLRREGPVLMAEYTPYSAALCRVTLHDIDIPCVSY